MPVYTFRESELQLTGRSELVVKLSMCSICSMTYLGGEVTTIHYSVTTERKSDCTGLYFTDQSAAWYIW